MKNLKILLLLFLPLVAKSQNYTELVKKADSLYSAENYLESANAFTEAFLLEEGNAGDYYDAACSWALSGDTTHSIKYLQLSVNKGWKAKKWMMNDKDLKSLHSQKEWEGILEQAQHNKDEYEKDFDKELLTSLELIYTKDQMLRQLWKDAEEKFGKRSDEMKYFWELVAKEDKENEKAVEEIIKEHGWVGKSLVGGKANTAIWLVIQHAPIETQEKYLPLLKESVLKGESKGSHLAMLEDRILMRKGEPQVYGSQVSYSDEGKAEVYEILEPEYVNQRRREVGLGTIEDYLSRWDIKWSIEQKEK